MEAPITIRPGAAGDRRRSFVIDCAEGLTHLAEREVWFEWDDGIPRSALMDDALAATVMLAMANRRDLRVEGPVTRDLYLNIHDFQQAWAAWRPDLFDIVDVEVSEIVDKPTGRQHRAVQAFGGGVDGIFTMATHTWLRSPDLRRPLDRAVFVHGFDIALDQQADFDRAAAKARAIAIDAGIDLSIVTTNVRGAIRVDWEMYHSAAIASVLLAYSPTYTHGLIGSGRHYADLAFNYPWGSNPVTDPLLSGALDIVHDGSGYSRTEKVWAVSGWAVALENMRVCWKSPDASRNCGKCQKCIATALVFRGYGLPVPRCFEREITPADILAVKIGSARQYKALKIVLELARARHVNGAWVDALHQRLAADRLRLDPPSAAAGALPFGKSDVRKLS